MQNKVILMVQKSGVHQLNMVNIPLFIGFHTCQVVIARFLNHHQYQSTTHRQHMLAPHLHAFIVTPKTPHAAGTWTYLLGADRSIRSKSTICPNFSIWMSSQTGPRVPGKNNLLIQQRFQAWPEQIRSKPPNEVIFVSKHLKEHFPQQKLANIDLKITPMKRGGIWLLLQSTKHFFVWFFTPLKFHQNENQVNFHQIPSCQFHLHHLFLVGGFDPFEQH